MKIKRFEDLKTWQAARALVRLIYEVSGEGAFGRDFGLRDQIRRAAGSTMHNIAEGFDAGSDAEFIRFLKYARRSASEVQSELYIALDCRYLSADQFQAIYDQATQLKKLINAFITYLKKPRPSQNLPDQPDQPTTRPADYPTNRLPDQETNL